MLHNNSASILMTTHALALFDTVGTGTCLGPQADFERERAEVDKAVAQEEAEDAAAIAAWQEKQVLL